MAQRSVTLFLDGEATTFHWPFGAKLVDITSAGGSRLASIEEAHQFFEELFAAGAR